MAVVNALKRKIASRVEELYFSTRSAARLLVGPPGGNGRDNYEGLKATLPLVAKQYLQSALNKPMSVKSRILRYAAQWNAEFGAGTFAPFVADGLRLTASEMTVAEMTTDLDTMIAQATVTINAVKSGSMTLDQAAQWVRDTWDDEARRIEFPPDPAFVELDLDT